MHGVTISEGDRMTLKRFKSDMASPVNSQLKCFIYFLIVAIFSFFLMFFLSPENKLYNIYHRKVTRPDIFGAAKDPETCTGRECVRGYVARHGRVMPEDQLVIAKVKG
ncbi:hypothetical protein HOLleu_37621 [Holothuria leucospilota]|uniref:Uncharacterized protein n=1 Tax=Holothuria leucospilota TaxID=206669 RepID=A0A9Q0YHE5_HOLLE|nr:hypothetical protein HOLleu_37621 [Holothuria leucospilota]